MRCENSQGTTCCDHHRRLHVADQIRGAAERLKAAIARRDFPAQIAAEAELDALKDEITVRRAA
jgi:hypothetical protein